MANTVHIFSATVLACGMFCPKCKTRLLSLNLIHFCQAQPKSQPSWAAVAVMCNVAIPNYQPPTPTPQLASSFLTPCSQLTNSLLTTSAWNYSELACNLHTASFQLFHKLFSFLLTYQKPTKKNKTKFWTSTLKS